MARKAKPLPEPLLISVLEMASMLGISKNQAYALLNRREVQSKYIGKRRLVVVESLREFVDRLPSTRPDN
jgi:hypothetical protein